MADVSHSRIVIFGIFQGRAPKSGADQITEYQEAAHDVQGGIRLLELSKKAYFSVQTARFKRKAKVAQFRVFELNMEGSNSHCDVSPSI